MLFREPAEDVRRRLLTLLGYQPASVDRLDDKSAQTDHLMNPFPQNPHAAVPALEGQWIPENGVTPVPAPKIMLHSRP